jgi:WD40 repeat protein
LDGDYSGYAFRTDSRVLATSTPDGTVRLYDTESGRELQRFHVAMPGASWVRLFWNPRRPQVLVFAPQLLRLLDLETGQARPVGPKLPGYCWAAWHPEGRRLAVSGVVSDFDQNIHLWDVDTNRAVVPPMDAQRGVVLRFNHAGDRLLGADWGLWRLWDARTGQQLFVQPRRGACVQFAPGDGLVGAETNFPRVRLFRFHAGQELRTLVRAGATRQPVYYTGRAVLNPEGRLLAVAAPEGVVLVDVRRTEDVSLVPLPGNHPLCFDSAGEALLTYGKDGLLRWPLHREGAGRDVLRVGPPDLLAGTKTQRILGSSRDGAVIAIPAADRGALLLRRGQEQPLLLGPQNDVAYCAVTPDGHWVATGSHGVREGAGAKVWDAREGKHVADLPVRVGTTVTFSPDGKWLLTTGGGFRLWAVGSWQEGPSLHGGADNRTCAFSADGKVLALGDAPGVVRLVRPDSGREVARLTAPEPTRLMPICFTPDGAELITVGTESTALHVFDLRAIGAGLKEIGLDWEMPDYPPAPATRPPPLEVRVELGDFATRAKAPKP